MVQPVPEPPTDASDRAKVLTFVDELIQYYSDRAAKYGRRLYWLKTLGIASSVLVTVLSGISALSTPYPWLITIVAGISTFLTTLLTTTKAQEYYVLSSGQQGKIEGELLLFYGSGGPYSKPPGEAERLRLLSERVNQIYAEGRTTWERVNRAEKGN